MLRGIIRGAWILRFDWITESANAGKWLYEEPFEVRNFSRAISVHTPAFFIHLVYKIEHFLIPDVPHRTSAVRQRI